MQEMDRYRELAYDPDDHRESRKRAGLAIRALREESGTSLKTLSKKIGVASSYISRVENGKVRASGKFVEKVADVLSASRFDLAVQSGLFVINWDRITMQELEEFKEIVDSGAYSLRR